MAGLEAAPWLQSGLEPAPWAVAEPAPGVAEDVAKAVPTGLAKGVIGLGGMGGDLQDLAKLGTDKLGNPFGWLAGKFEEHLPNASKFLKEESAKTAKGPIGSALAEGSGDIPGTPLPSSHDIQGQVEKVTGKFPEAKTGIGKAVQTAGEVLPAIATGGGSVPGMIAKAVGAGGTSELAGEAAANLKGHLPDWAQPWAEPVARAGGAVTGSFAPAAIRRAVTPLPMEAEQAATVAALRASNPELLQTATAGQLTNTPGLRALEARAPSTAGVPAAQEEAFTHGVMRTMGQDGLATPQNIAAGRTIGDNIGNIRRSNEINPAEFPALNRDVGNIVRRHAGTVGQDDAATLRDIQSQIRLGAANTPNVASMPGRRYDYMRQKLQDAIDRAPTGTENRALSDTREALDAAFHRSIPNDLSQQLRHMETQYANYNILKNKTPTGKDTVSPQEVSKAVASGFGNAAVNENRGTLAPLARDASRVMTEFPKPTEGGGPLSRITGALIGGAGGGAAGHIMGLPATPEAIVGAILGGERAGDVVHLLKNTAGRAAASSPAQAYLRNQLWTPGRHTTADAATIARLLMSPPVTGLLPDQRQ